MKKFALSILLLAGTCHAMAADPPAPFTQDLDAALTYAKEANLPVMLDFSGSDWCGWCKLMDANVFEKDEWKGWASSNLVTVLVDFPSDESLVPEAWRARNRELAENYGIEGFPTFVLLAPGGGEEIARLGASANATPASFVESVRAALREADPAAIAAVLSPEEAAEFAALKARVKVLEKIGQTEKAAAEAEIDAWDKRLSAAKKDAPDTYDALREEAVADLSAKRRERSARIRAAAEEYEKSEERLAELRKKLLP